MERTNGNVPANVVAEGGTPPAPGGAAPDPKPAPAPAPESKPAPAPTPSAPQNPPPPAAPAVPAQNPPAAPEAPPPADPRLAALTAQNEQLSNQLAAIGLGVDPKKTADFLALAASRATAELPLPKAMEAVLAEYPAFAGAPPSLGGASNPGAGSDAAALEAQIRAAVNGQ